MEGKQGHADLENAPESQIDDESTQPLIDSVDKISPKVSEELQTSRRSQSRVKHAALYELSMVLILFAVVSTFTKTLELQRRAIPQVALPGGGFLNQSSLSYPVYLNGETCSATTLLGCDLEASTPSSTCCQVLGDPLHLGPEETVPFHQALAICLLTPLAYFFFRALKYRCAEQAIRDAAGLGLAVTCSIFFIGVAKRLVGRPRPNFYALVAYASHSRAPRSHLEIVAYESFPSGHAATTMAAMLFLGICFARDAREKYLKFLPRPLSLFLWIGAAAPVFLSFWVGLTRIHDYWHSFDDVAVGWAIGGTSAVFAFLYGSIDHESRADSVIKRYSYRIDDGL